MRKLEDDLVSIELMRAAIKLGFDWECAVKQEGVPIASLSWMQQWLAEVKKYWIKIELRSVEKYDKSTNTSITTSGYCAGQIQHISEYDTSAYSWRPHSGIRVYTSAKKFGRKLFSSYKDCFEEGLKKVFNILEDEEALK